MHQSPVNPVRYVLGLFGEKGRQMILVAWLRGTAVFLAQPSSLIKDTTSQCLVSTELNMFFPSYTRHIFRLRRPSRCFLHKSVRMPSMVVSED